jgi:hypothetical protein
LSRESDIEFNVPGLTTALKDVSAECYCSRPTLDDLLSDEVMALVLRSAGYEPDEFREMMVEIAWKNPVRAASQPDPLHFVLA